MHAAMRAMSALRRFLQGREPGQHRLVVPPNRHTRLRATDPWRWGALPKGGLLGGYVDVCVPIRGGEVDVAEPAADHVDLDAGLEEMDSCRVAKNVGTDPAGSRTLVLQTGRMPPDELVDTEPKQARTATRSVFFWCSRVVWGQAQNLWNSANIEFYPGEIPPSNVTNGYCDISAFTQTSTQFENGEIDVWEDKGGGDLVSLSGKSPSIEAPDIPSSFSTTWTWVPPSVTTCRSCWSSDCGRPASSSGF